MRHTLQRAAALAILAGSAFAMLGLGASEAEEGPYPGLPAPEQQELPLRHASWTGAANTSLADVERARQWMRTPLMTVAADFYQGRVEGFDATKYRQCTKAGANIYFVAQPGSAYNYGQTPDIVVRTVTFGAVPVEATVRLEQERADGLPVPIKLETLTCARLPPFGVEVPDSPVKGRVSTRVMSVRVDGVSLPFQGECRTRESGVLDLSGEGYLMGWDGSQNVPARVQPDLWNEGLFNLSPGGLLAGTVDVPPFSGCVTTSGDDLSSLLTATVSGEGFPLRTYQGGVLGCTVPNPGGKNLPPAPGASTPESVPCRMDVLPPQVPPLPEIPTSGQ
ncbi:hypothetical protein ACIO3S_18320 [Nocardioides sp. NPDC087217]|uniref:hypothetical protein n=1 Tax=Nocardioides sp. NPDC087217 TaxID=3364335 RepID=UPI00380808AE